MPLMPSCAVPGFAHHGHDVELGLAFQGLLDGTAEMLRRREPSRVAYRLVHRVRLRR
jgi:hypothetical protein